MPESYRNYIQPQQGFTQTQGFIPQQPQPQIQGQNSILTVFVNSEDEVNFYPVAAGVTVMLVSFNLKKFWLKSTEKNGIPGPLRVFDFNEVTPAPQNQGNENYVTKEEMALLSSKLDKLISSLGGES